MTPWRNLFRTSFNLWTSKAVSFTNFKFLFLMSVFPLSLLWAIVTKAIVCLMNSTGFYQVIFSALFIVIPKQSWKVVPRNNNPTSSTSLWQEITDSSRTVHKRVECVYGRGGSEDYSNHVLGELWHSWWCSVGLEEGSPCKCVLSDVSDDSISLWSFPWLDTPSQLVVTWGCRICWQISISQPSWTWKWESGMGICIVLWCNSVILGWVCAWEDP